MQQRQDRRAKKRGRVAYSLTIAHPEYSTSAVLENISPSGAYCQVGHPIPEMTKLKLVFRLPENASSNRPLHEIKCQGVVVRSERPSPDSATCYIAILFTDLKDADKRRLEHAL